MKSLVIYSSNTGNTKKIAEAIFEVLPTGKEMKNIHDDFNVNNFDIIFLGYWVDKGMCDVKSQQLYTSLHHKKIVLFGTMGATVGDAYSTRTKKDIESIIPSDNKILGHFVCQGKLADGLKERYESLIKQYPNDIHIKIQLRDYDSALHHPNENDLENAKTYIKQLIKNL